VKAFGAGYREATDAEAAQPVLDLASCSRRREERAGFGNPPYAGLSLADKRCRFLRVTFPSIEVRPDAEEAELRELYDRLAFGGVPHEPSERAVTSVETS
jgi:hypothetical protein